MSKIGQKEPVLIAALIVGVVFLAIDATADEATTTAVSFLKMDVGSRPQAMGGAQVADAEGGLALFWNPAGLWRTRGRSLLFSYHRSRFDITQSVLVFSQRMGSKGGWGLGANYVSLGDIEVRSGPTDEPEGVTEAEDLAVYVGYGRELPGNLSLGLVGKFIREKLHEDEGLALALDIGMGYQYERLKLGAALQNLSEGIKFREETFHLPTMAKLGAAFSPFGGRLTIAADLDQPLFEGGGRKLHFGAEGVLREILSIRGGYTHYSKKGDLGGLTGFTTGVGFDYGGWGIAYTFAPSENLGDIHQISMSLDLDRAIPTMPPPGQPPVIHITSPQDGSAVEGESVRLSGYVDDDKAISYLEISVNEEILSTRGRRGVSTIISRLRFSEEVRLREGRNFIRLTAYDTEDLSNTRSIVIERISKKGQIYAVIIGINEYESAHIRDLKYTSADALAFKEFLRSRQGGEIPEENIQLFLNETATKENIKSALWDWLPLKANKRKDRVMIFYAGHGILYRNKGLFVTHRSDPDRWGGTALPMEDVNTAFGMIEAGQILFFSDACHSGVVTEEMKVAERGADLGGEVLLDRFSGVGRVIMTASRMNEGSVEVDEYGHGLFTYFLLKGLKGEADRRENGGNQDGYVDIDEAYSYTYNQVADKAAEMGLLQHPQQDKRVEGKIYLSKVR